MRILITGSRDWTNWRIIHGALCDYLFEEQVVLVSGACPTGADRMAEKWARGMGYEVETHPADWDQHGKKAGFIRNKEMVDLGADICLAFIKNNSKGATMTLNLAEKAGIRTKVWRE